MFFTLFGYWVVSQGIGKQPTVFTPFGCLEGGKAPLKGLGHNLLVQFSTL